VEGVGWVQTLVFVLAAGLALAVASVPRRRRSLGQIAALAAAVLLALQLAVDHWFYLYLPWVTGLVAAGFVNTRFRDLDGPSGS
jgi:peptidoglycan/LPS O-acetylase OafA/YrhL